MKTNTIKTEVEDPLDFLNVTVQKKKATKALLLAKQLEEERKQQGYKYRKLDEHTKILTLKTEEDLVETRAILEKHYITFKSFSYKNEKTA